MQVMVRMVQVLARGGGSHQWCVVGRRHGEDPHDALAAPRTLSAPSPREQSERGEGWGEGAPKAWASFLRPSPKCDRGPNLVPSPRFAGARARAAPDTGTRSRAETLFA